MIPSWFRHLRALRVPAGLSGWALLSLLPGILAAEAGSGAALRPLPQAHSHNDYEQKRPLLEALDHGFCSVEADVFLVEGSL